MKSVSPVSPGVPLIIDLLERVPAASPFALVAFQSAPMGPSRSRCPLDISISDGSRPAGAREAQYVAGPPKACGILPSAAATRECTAMRPLAIRVASRRHR
ncbi:unnamed protein product [Heligmosomoides polygyrus]|uniref:Uncharacterized protein n=1 Tax=Heligmosomoides polygyrus TaxID=6339 RepID=A0A183FSY7_HELPZ|nr:unnamed protein product [Heligmosomoides polygyrus]